MPYTSKNTMSITFTFDFDFLAFTGLGDPNAYAWTLHHDKAPVHTALSIRQFLTEKNTATLEHTPPHIPPMWSSVAFSSSPRSHLFLRKPIFLTSIPSKWPRRRSSKRSQKMPSKGVLNPAKSECTSVLKWKEITLKEFDFGIFQYFSIKFL